MSCLVVSCVLVLLNCTSQSSSTTAATNWPDSLDAVIAAPDNHRILLENEQVRVLEVTIKPHEKEPVHAHRWPSVLYIDKAGAFRDYDGEGKVLFDSRKASEPMKYPMTRWQGPQAPHAVENLSDEPVHLIRVELKK
jgi:quercetin dioxygenase-like cupin family protein